MILAAHLLFTARHVAQAHLVFSRRDELKIFMSMNSGYSYRVIAGR